MLLVINDAVMGNIANKKVENNSWIYKMDDGYIYEVPFRIMALPPRVRNGAVIIETKEGV